MKLPVEAAEVEAAEVVGKVVRAAPAVPAAGSRRRAASRRAVVVRNNRSE